MLPKKIEKVLRELEEDREKEIQKELKGEEILKTDRSLAIPREEGKFLYLLTKAMKAKRILEIGTSFGYSTIWLAMAAKEEKGKVITVDILPKKIGKAKENLKKTGLENCVEFILGDAKEVIRKLERPVDIVFLDADKRDYIEFIKLSLENMRVGGIILSDNVLDCPEIHKDDPEICEELMDFINKHPKMFSVTVPFLPNGLEMTMKISE
ncbi:MAG: O-methyltransferase [Candidatus Hodarchaeales archaeon]|jgi:predicted O-methyltransferase YrrM